MQWTIREGQTAFPLFAKDAPDNWTIAALSELKDMAAQLSIGGLRWMLATRMPIRADFKLFLNDKLVEPEKEKGNASS
jgi:hypothetical protein